MRSRTSLFNKTVLLKDITRFCPVWIIYSVLMLMPALGTISTASLQNPSVLAAELGWGVSGMAISCMVYAMVCAFFLFGDLFKSRLCNALHAFPMRRESWFATHTLAGILFFLVPTTAVAVLYLPYLGQYGSIALLWLLASTVMYLFFFALAAVCVMLTGSRFAASAVYLIINFFSVLCYWFVSTYYAPLLPGLYIRDDIFFWFCPVAVLSSNELFLFEDAEYLNGLTYNEWTYQYQGLTDGWWYVGITGALALALLGLGVVLYRKRKLEAAGDFLAFRKPMPVFLVIFALSIGAIFQGIFGLLDSNVISMLIGLVVGCYAGQMLLRRTVKVFDKRSAIWCGAIVGALALTLAVTAIDPLGLTRWTPEPEQVRSITLSDNYDHSDESDYYYSYDKSATVTDPALIEKLVSIHEKILTEDLSVDQNTAYMLYDEVHAIHLTYHMNDGREVVRRYYYTDATVYNELEPFYSAVSFVLGYDDFDEFFSHVVSVSLDGQKLSSGASAKALLAAVWADCEAGNMAQNQSYLNATDYYIEIETEDQYLDLTVYESCTNTLAWIKNRADTY